MSLDIVTPTTESESNHEGGGNLIRRTFEILRQVWQDGPVSHGTSPAELAERISHCMAAPVGAVSARARAVDLAGEILDMDGDRRMGFLNILAGQFAAPAELVDGAMALVRVARTLDDRRRAERGLARALETPARKLNGLPGGMKLLVDLRAQLLSHAGDDGRLASLEGELKSLPGAWFDMGFLELQRITWDSPASVLEKLISYEAVHEIKGWDDLERRLAPDRRCYAYFHPHMAGEPLIFVEVALAEGLPGEIAPLIDPMAPLDDLFAADTAVLYSISNAQKGLAGIGFGGYLVRRVVQMLKAEFPYLENFVTLSPVPGFVAWLDRLPAAEMGLDDRSRGLLCMTWHCDPVMAEALKEPLMGLCARYLVEQSPGAGRLRDPVAHFHLSNGASLSRLNWLADVSPGGIGRSAGMMANYVYRLSRLEEKIAAYRDGRPHLAEAVSRLLPG